MNEGFNIPQEVYDNQTIRTHVYANGMVVEGGNPRQIIDGFKTDVRWQEKIKIIP